MEKSSRPDIVYAVHQCACFSQDPKQSHTRAVIHIVKYQMRTSNKGPILRANKEKSLECFVDADFCGNWNKLASSKDTSIAKSRTGYLIRSAGCPIVWGAKLQTQIAVSTSETEYIALSTAMREVIPIINIIQELRERKFIEANSTTDFHCKVFQDNSGALELAKKHRWGLGLKISMWYIIGFWNMYGIKQSKYIQYRLNTNQQIYSQSHYHQRRSYNTGKIYYIGKNVIKYHFSLYQQLFKISRECAIIAILMT